MKILLILCLSVLSVFGEVYYSKIEPYEVRDISSNVAGEVVFTDENMIGKKLTNSAYIKIDDILDKNELKSTNKKIIYLENILVLNKQTIDELEAILKKKKVNYDRIRNLTIKSQVDKDREFYDLASSQISLINTKKEIDNLKIQISDLYLRKKQLEKKIVDKNIKAKGFVLYSLFVKAGKVVTPSMLLAKVADTSKAILTIYVDAKELEGIKNKVIYLDGIKTKYKVSRVLNIADSQNISKYMVQIVINPPKVFSKLVKVELRDE